MCFSTHRNQTGWLWAENKPYDKKSTLFVIRFSIIFAALNYYYRFHNENSGKLSMPELILIVSRVTLIAIGTS